MRIKLLILTLSLITLSSCSCIGSQGRLTDLPPLVIPENLKIADSEWKCLANEVFWKCPAYIKLGKRDKLKDARIQTLVNKIKSTH
jgi:hypothetical protein